MRRLRPSLCRIAGTKVCHQTKIDVALTYGLRQRTNVSCHSEVGPALFCLNLILPNANFNIRSHLRTNSVSADCSKKKAGAESRPSAERWMPSSRQRERTIRLFATGAGVGSGASSQRLVVVVDFEIAGLESGSTKSALKCPNLRGPNEQNPDSRIVYCNWPAGKDRLQQRPISVTNEPGFVPIGKDMRRVFARGGFASSMG